MKPLDDSDKAFLQACAEIKDRVSAAHQQVNDTMSHKIIDWIWDEIKLIEDHRMERGPMFDEVTEKIHIHSEPPKTE